MATKESQDFICASGIGGARSTSMDDALADCLRRARIKWPGKYLLVEARDWEKDYGDVLPDGFVLIRPFSKKPQ